MTQTLRLSGYNYIRNYIFLTTKIGKWRTDEGDDSYEYCTDKNCMNSAEHEYAFDGQVFYKKKRKLHGATR